MTGRAWFLLLALAGLLGAGGALAQAPASGAAASVAAAGAGTAAAAAAAAGVPAEATGPGATGATAAASAAAAPATPALPGGGTARPLADDPELEKRLVGLTRELRCLVCQNESIADSHAPLAVDMRNEIREQLRAGKTDRQVIDFMVARYGNFVRFRPPLDATTIALWFGPALLLLIGLGALGRQLLRRRALAEAAAAGGLCEAERAALTQLAGDAAPTTAPPGARAPGAPGADSAARKR